MAEDDAEHSCLYQYRLFTPYSNAGDKRQFPLIVWFHGHGFDELEYENTGQLKHLESLIFHYPEHREKYPFFLLAVQCPKTFDKWFSDNDGHRASSSPIEAVYAIVNRIVGEHPIARDQVLLAGVSSGASACWELAARYPDQFTAIAPIACAEEISIHKLKRIVDLPVWAFNSDGNYPERARRTISELQGLGGRCHLSEVPSNVHDCWTAAFRDYGLLRWILLQKQHSINSPFPGTLDRRAHWMLFRRDFISPWLSWRFVPSAAIAAALLAVFYVGHRKVRHVVGNAEMSIPAIIERSGFTLVEVLVVIAIIGVLVALILPAVEMARESSRRSACANNLRQLAIGVKLHTDTNQIFPTGGWGGDWLGNPDAGYGTKQPGGWVYSILSYIEEDNLRQLGRGLKDPPREEALTTLMQTPLPVLHCPSRRLPRTYPYTGGELKNAKPPETVAKTDYAISKSISYEKSEVILSDIQLHGKGMSKTALAGEKSLSLDSYVTGTGAGDTLVAYVGDSEDIRREPSGSPSSDATGGTGFGGPHPGGTNVAYCDGSVRFVTEEAEIEP